MEKRLFLTMDQDKVWSAQFHSDSAPAEGIPFVKEGSYPAELYFARTDINGSRIVDRENCKNDEDLISVLNWCGKCGYSVLSLWDFDIEKEGYDQAVEIFNEGLLNRLDKLQKEMDSISNTMTVLVVEPEKKPYVKEIDKGLESLQHEVGGWIEATYPFDEPVAIICNEEGKLNGLPLNRSLCDEEGFVYDILAGTFLVTGLGEDDFCSLSKEYLDQFSKLFETPEAFARINGQILVFPMEEASSTQVTKETEGLTVTGHIGTWHTIEAQEVSGKMFFLMEHDFYGDDAANVIVDDEGKLILDDVYNGFDEEAIEAIQETLRAPSLNSMLKQAENLKDSSPAGAKEKGPDLEKE